MSHQQVAVSKYGHQRGLPFQSKRKKSGIGQVCAGIWQEMLHDFSGPFSPVQVHQFYE